MGPINFKHSYGCCIRSICRNSTTNHMGNIFLNTLKVGICQPFYFGGINMIHFLAQAATVIWLLWAIIFGLALLLTAIVKIISVFKDMQGDVYMTDTETLLFSIFALILVIIIGTRNKQLH